MTKVAVIGNSFVGAVMKALQADPALSGGYAMDFAGSAGGAFHDIRLEDGHFVNVRASDRFRTGHIGEYGALFVYGIFPSPHSLTMLARRLARGKYSSQVIAAAMHDAIEGSQVYPVYRRIREATDAPVHVLSANVNRGLGPITPEEYRQGVAWIRDVIGESYVETPRALFTPDLAPEADFYRGSVNIAGAQFSGEKQEVHDYNHFNERGGAVILKAMIDRLPPIRDARQPLAELRSAAG